MLHVGADDARGGLRPERPALAVLVAGLQEEQLLLDDVGDLADPSLEHGDLLEQRRLDRVVAVACRKVGGDSFQPRHPDPLAAAAGRGSLGVLGTWASPKSTGGRHGCGLPASSASIRSDTSR